jgi:hypothetical protein
LRRKPSESGAEASDVEDYLEEEEEQQQQQKQASAEVAITNTGQRNHQPNCAAVCVQHQTDQCLLYLNSSGTPCSSETNEVNFQSLYQVL